MRLFSWMVTFIITLFIAMVLVLTFTQQEFKTTVGAQIITYKTRQLPVYLYVAGAFAFGLALGVFQVIFTFIRAKAEIFRKNKMIRELEQKVESLEQQIKELTAKDIQPAESLESSLKGDIEPTE
jgi:uncharacterized membrane protein YciS (DUF1049 family)